MTAYPSLTQTRQSLRERRREILRVDVLQVAQLLVAEKGYTALSMDEVAARCGISKPTLYSLFESKDELVSCAVAHALITLCEIVETRVSGVAPVEHLLLMLRTALGMPHCCSLLRAALWAPDVSQRISADAAVRGALARIDTALTELVTRAIEAGDIDPSLDPQVIVLSIYALLSASQSWRAPHGTKMRSDDARAVMVTLFEHSVRRPIPQAQLRRTG